MVSNGEVSGDPATRSSSLPGSFPGESPSPPTSPTITSQRSLTRALYARRSEFTVKQTLRVKIGTWNVASLAGTEKDVGDWFIRGKGVLEELSGLQLDQTHGHDVAAGNDTGESKGENESLEDQEARQSKKQSTLPKNDPGILPGDDDIELYVLGLQEIVDISSPAEALRPFSDPGPARKWKFAVSAALAEDYKLVAEQQMMGLLLLVYAAPHVVPSISNVSCTSVGTGVMGYMGNKGAVSARIILGETTRLVFVNCHLAAGMEKGSLDRRNWDASQIVMRTKFESVQHGDGVIEEFGEGIGEEDFAFWLGDLNYRLESMAGDDVRRLLQLHTDNAYDQHRSGRKSLQESRDGGKSTAGHSPEDPEVTLANESNNLQGHAPPPSYFTLSDEGDPQCDPASLQTTLSSLLPHDQLLQQIRKRKAFYDGWREGPIKFVPTYKYDVGSVGMFDSSEKRRGPSWCDRILYRTRRDRLAFHRRVVEERIASQRDAEMTARGLDKSDDDVLFDYDPDNDGIEEYVEETPIEAAQPELMGSKAGPKDSIELDLYTSHQRVLSSDHKPLEAVFTLTYDAVDLHLKAAINQDVARELDKVENETRPMITVIIERNSANTGDECLDFGDIRYDEAKMRNVTIANTGRVPATLGFVDRQTKGASPPWLSIIFDRPSGNSNSNATALHQYTLEPGETASVQLVLHVTSIDDVRSLNNGTMKLEDVLILRVQEGRDDFLSVCANWLASSFGRSLDNLVRIPEDGARNLNFNPDGGGLTTIDAKSPVKWSAPREIFRLTEVLEDLVERAVAEWDMRDETELSPWNKLPGWPFLKESWQYTGKGRDAAMFAVRESLDTGHAFTFDASMETWHKVEIFAATLLAFLASLDDSIIDTRLWTTLTSGLDARDRLRPQPPSTDDDTRAWILDSLSSSPARSVTFTFITFMLARVANELAPLPKPAPNTPIHLHPSLHSPLHPPLPPFPSSPLPQQESFLRPRKPSPHPATAKRQALEKTFADIFARAMFSSSLPGRARERRLAEERRRELVEVLMRSKWSDGF